MAEIEAQPAGAGKAGERKAEHPPPVIEFRPGEASGFSDGHANVPSPVTSVGSLNLLRVAGTLPNELLCARSARLYDKVQTALPFHVGDEIQLFQTLLRGAQSLSSKHLVAKDWANVFAEVLCQLGNGSLRPKTGRAVEPNRIACILRRQPRPTFTHGHHNGCVALGTYVAIQTISRGESPPLGILDGLEMLFKSNSLAWDEMRDTGLIEALPLTKLSSRLTNKAAAKFCRQLAHFLAHPVASVEATLGRRPTRGEVETTPLTDRAVAKLDLVLAPPATRELAPVDTNPDEDLFGTQLAQDQDAPQLTGYRVELQWGRLSPEELKVVLDKLADDLSSTASGEDIKLNRLHAALRLVSLFAGVSIKTTFRLPLQRYGTMFLDLERQTIVRDANRAAPRTDHVETAVANSRWWSTPLPRDVCQTIIDTWKLHPQCKTIGQLSVAAGLELSAFHALLNANHEGAHLPEDARFSNSLASALRSLGIHPSIAVRVSGNTGETPKSDIHYLSLRQADIYAAVDVFCKWVGLAFDAQPNGLARIGSPHYIEFDVFKEALANLSTSVAQAKRDITTRSTIDEAVAFSNIYVTAIALQLLWAIGGRTNRIESLTANRLLVNSDHILLTDKDTDSYSVARICPLSEPLKKSRLAYIEHLRSMADRLDKCRENKCAKKLRAITSGTQSTLAVFKIIQGDSQSGFTCRSLTRPELSQFATVFLAGPMNRPRHFIISELVERGVEQVAIDAFVGHHTTDSEPFGIGSGISVLEYLEYMRPRIEVLHRDLQLAPLTGLGRTASRYLALPTFDLGKRGIKPIPNKFLKQKLAIDDFNPCDLRVSKQDAPFSTDTLIGYDQVCRLRKRYLHQGYLKIYPAGAVLLCLVLFDAVVVMQELDEFFRLLAHKRQMAIENCAVIEIEVEGRPVAQRILSIHTCLALAQMYAIGGSPEIDGASVELGNLLEKLDAAWKKIRREDRTSQLLTIASHSVALEVPPAVQVALFHKAPFLRAEDLARIRSNLPCKPNWEPKKRAVSVSNCSNNFRAVLAICSEWGSHDVRSGEDRKRKNGLSNELRELAVLANFDTATQTLVGWLLAESGQYPPARTIKTSTIAQYASALRPFFLFVREWDTLEFDADEWREIVKGFPQTHTSQSDHYQNALRHLVAWLREENVWMPTGLFNGGNGRKTNYFPRLPTFISERERDAVAKALDKMFANVGGSQADASLRLRLQHAIPLRIQEVRYGKLADFDPRANLFHVTSHGNNHLKFTTSRGSARVPANLGRDLEALKTRREHFGDARAVPLFSDPAGEVFDDFEQVSNATIQLLQEATGRYVIAHDLRVTAATNMIIDVENAVRHVVENRLPETSNQPLQQRFARVANAASAARHSSTFTTIRSYSLGAFIEARMSVDRAINVIPSMSYLSAATNKKNNTLDVQLARATAANLDDPASSREHFTHNLLREQSHTNMKTWRQPVFSSVVEVVTTAGQLVDLDRARTIETCLLRVFGHSIRSAADVARMPLASAERAYERYVNFVASTKLPENGRAPVPLILHSQSTARNSIQPLSKWLAEHADTISKIAPQLVVNVTENASAISISDEPALSDWLSVLNAFVSTGFSVCFEASSLVEMHVSQELRASLAEQSVPWIRERTPSPGLGLLRFTSRRYVDAQLDADRLGVPFSPKSFGSSGKMVVTGLVITAALHR